MQANQASQDQIHEFAAILKNVNKVYKMGEVQISALKNINLEIKRGEFITILGPSGSDKNN